MGLSFLAPLFAIGMGLLAAPYLIHQIRRPDREPMKFSSLLFIPDVKKEVIERKRIEHILLLLMRMMVLALLALAFARPYWASPAASEFSGESARHLILLDNSYSMAAGNGFERARDAANDIVNDLADDDLVGVMLFGANGQMARPIAPKNESDSTTAASAIETATLSSEKTNYLGALEAAYRQAMTTINAEDELRPRVVFHIISDFQRNGMPDGSSSWKAPSFVEMNLVSVAEDVKNAGLTNVGVRKYPNGDLRVVTKVQNWTDEVLVDYPVVLYGADDRTIENRVTIQPNNGRRTSFRISREEASAFEGKALLGSIRIQDDDLATDNIRYFSWSPARKQSVVLVGIEREGMRWPAVRLMEQALANRDEMPWVRTTVAPDELSLHLRSLTEPPSVIILSDYLQLDDVVVSDLRQYVSMGGALLLCASGSEGWSESTRALLADTNLEGGGLKYAKPRSSRYSMMSWVDLEHDIFARFQGSQYNDFSSLRLFNFVSLDIPAEQESTRVIARLDDDSPVMVETSLGAGQLIVWPFSLQLDWTNFPKTNRFVPVLHETLYYLNSLDDSSTATEIGARVSPTWLSWNEEGKSELLLPGIDDVQTVDRGEALAETSTPTLAQPGHLQQRPAGSTEWESVVAVNVDGSEGDDTPVTEAEFLLKLATRPIVSDNGEAVGVVGTEIDTSGRIIDEEYGRLALAGLLLLLLTEFAYMNVLSRAESRS